MNSKGDDEGYKTRFDAKVFTQKKGVDFGETLSDFNERLSQNYYGTYGIF